MDKHVTAWAVFTKRGKLLLSTIAPTRREAIAQHCEPQGWPDEHAAGYRCQPVTIRPQQEQAHG